MPGVGGGGGSPPQNPGQVGGPSGIGGQIQGRRIGGVLGIPSRLAKRIRDLITSPLNRGQGGGGCTSGNCGGDGGGGGGGCTGGNCGGDGSGGGTVTADGGSPPGGTPNTTPPAGGGPAPPVSGGAPPICTS